MSTTQERTEHEALKGRRLFVTIYAYSDGHGVVLTSEGVSTQVHSDEEAIGLLAELWRELSAAAADA